MTWRRFFDVLEPMHALVAEEGETLIGFAHYLFHRSTAQMEFGFAICRTCSRWKPRAAGGLAGP